MKNKFDAFGHLLYDQSNGKDPVEIVERDDGYVDASRLGPALYFSEYRKWNNINKKAIKYTKGKVLDIGCGAGRFSLYLQNRGHYVLGIDNSPLAIKVCKERGIKHLKEMSITKISKNLGVFDTIIMMGNNFGLLGNPKRARWLLKKMYNITSKDGLIIAETNDVYKTNMKEHLDYHKFNKKRGRMAGQTTLRILYKKYKGNWFDYLFVSPEELKDILKDTGWKIKEIISTPESPIYNVIIKK